MNPRRLLDLAAAFAVLWAFDAMGGVVVRAAHVPIPGTVVGILGLLGAFLARGGVPGPMEDLARFLIGHLNLLYIPAAVGVVAYASLVRRDASPIGVALVGSAVIGLVVTGWTFQIVDRRAGRGRDAR
jgi:holin-like protein